MKIKYIIFSSLLLLITYSHNLKTKKLQYINPETDFNYSNKNPFAPVLFTANGLNDFFENIYNQSWYGKDFLPSNFTHMIQFLQYGKETKQNGAFLKSVLKLFSNKLKASSWVNSYAIVELLEIMPALVKHYFEPPKIDIFVLNKNVQKLISDSMYNNFLSNFSTFRQTPKLFLNTMSENIVSTLHNHTSQIYKKNVDKKIDAQVNLEHLRQALTRFLELAFSKLIWSPEDHKNTWHLFETTSKTIENFSKEKILDDMDNLDDLYWSVVQRFCFFLEIAGHEMPIEFYPDFKNKLLSANLLMFQIQEQEQYITNKETQLVQALFESEAKARAYTQGLIVR